MKNSNHPILLVGIDIERALTCQSLTFDKISIIPKSLFHLFLASSLAAYVLVWAESFPNGLIWLVITFSIVIPIQGWNVRVLFSFRKICRWCKQNMICKYDEYPAKICHQPWSWVKGTNKKFQVRTIIIKICA